MQERLLQFIWQYSLYNPTGLVTNDGEQLTIIHPGIYNTNSGPDFLQGRIKIGDTILAGNIELHINSSDWDKHGHQYDDAYKNIVLHVVYKNDAATTLENVPVLTIAPYIAPALLGRYETMMQDVKPIACSGQLGAVKDIIKESWLTRLLAERWEEKHLSWKDLLDKSAGDWRNLLYWRMAANFGFKVNADPFLQLALSIPLNVFTKGGSLLQVEAILFGQAGMLNEEFKDDYPNKLKQEYNYLRQKYRLEPMPAHLWKFLRMRPANFPTIRIAQFAALIHQSFHLFSQIIEKHEVKDILPLLDVTANEYWDDHYRFDELSETFSKKHLGKASIQNIIINTIAPTQFLYASSTGDDALQEKALRLLEVVNAERNNIIDLWQDVAWRPANAAQSQALIQLYNNYCSKKRCLDCAVGLSLLKSRPNES